MSAGNKYLNLVVSNPLPEPEGINETKGSRLTLVSEGDEDMATQGELTDAKLAKAAAETDTKIARLEGKLDTMTAMISGKLDNLRELEVRDHDYNRTTRWVIAGLVLALFAGFVAVLSYGGDQWGRGLNTRDLIQSTIKDFQEGQKKAASPVTPSAETKQ